MEITFQQSEIIYSLHTPTNYFNLNFSLKDKRLSITNTGYGTIAFYCKDYIRLSSPIAAIDYHTLYIRPFRWR